MSDENEEYVITIADVEAELPPQDYETLTLGDDNVAVRCLVKAKVFVKGMITSTGHEYDEHNDVCREAVLKRTLYELFAFVGQEERAKEKLEDCELLIQSHYGPILKKTDTTDGSGPAVAVVNRSRRNPLKESL